MRVAIASDHEGFRLKERIMSLLESMNHEVIDLGCNSREPVDYPDYALAIGKALRTGTAQRAVFLCGSGVGACIAANKLPGVRAAVCHDLSSARMSIEDHDTNVLCLGANMIAEQLAEEVVAHWITSRFSELARHRRRVEKVHRMDLRLDQQYA